MWAIDLQKVEVLRVPDAVESRAWKCVAYYSMGVKTVWIYRFFPSRKQAKRWAAHAPKNRLPRRYDRREDSCW